MHEEAKVFPECFSSGQIRFIFPETCRAIYLSFDSEPILQSETKRAVWHPVDSIFLVDCTTQRNYVINKKGLMLFKK